MTSKGSRRYPLVIYTHMMNRWRPWIFWLGAALLGMAGIVFYTGMERWRWMTFAGVGIFNILASVVMWLARNSAYAQIFPTHLRLVTPFLRMNISYKRFRRLGPALMGALFPPSRVSRAQAEVVEQLAGMTAVIIELSSFPMSQTAMRFFLSPLFFKDKTPHIIILVEDWMRFSTEIDSTRNSGNIAAPQVQQPRQQQETQQPQKKRKTSSSILSKLPPKK